MFSSEIIFFSSFILFIIIMLALDLGIFSKSSHVISFKEATIWSVVWVSLAILFFVFLRYEGHLIHNPQNYEEIMTRVDVEDKELLNIKPDNNHEDNLQVYRNYISVEFITAYLIEYALSADNIFVMILIFSSFGLKEQYFKKVLFWGVLGAIVMRFIFIFIGIEIVKQFHFVLWIFGAFLVYQGIKIFFEKEEEEEAIDPQKHPIVRLASRYLSVYPHYEGDKFFVKKDGKKMITTLFIVLLIIEFTDLVFAVDSVPAVLGITHDQPIAYFSNIFAIMGLRSMFFLLSNIMHLFHYLKYGLGALLTFVGAKMLLEVPLKAINFKPMYSIFIILGILTVSIALSLIFPKKEDKNEKTTPS
ncbi:MAG: TerC/Alx family metal homeostasis membrane protein [Thermonemataceae bacterium]|nr:TerC/Alx family metal homeostasis membrane protein [Thermonemataceae bacterium]